MNAPIVSTQLASRLQQADLAQHALTQNYWNPRKNLFERSCPAPSELDDTPLHYWWLAHALDALTDRYERTQDPDTRQRMNDLLAGLVRANGGVITNDYYDDMEWLALACLRAFDATGEPGFAEATTTLWQDIKTGWNTHCDGGIAWRKFQMDYKNTPANAPAAILAARLNGRLGISDGLDWAIRIYHWNREHLVEASSGFVWDGMNREGDGLVDHEWRYTYCQGVMVGAGVELYRLTTEEHYLAEAVQTARKAVTDLVDPVSGALQYEEQGDGGLFKGILIRYLLQLLLVHPDAQIRAALTTNADSLWANARTEGGLFGPDWAKAPVLPIDLSTHLSGVFLLEAMLRLPNGL